MAKYKKNDLKIEQIVNELQKMEKTNDNIIAMSRPIVRKCANAIKMLHVNDIQNAKKEIEQIEKEVAGFEKNTVWSKNLLIPILQEVVEAKLLMCAIEKKPLLNHKQLKVCPDAYLLGICDVIGEFRRQMLEELKDDNKQQAQYYFDLMQDCYEQISIVRFSNSLLPNFRRKQDVARMQLEQARSEIVRSGMR